MLAVNDGETANGDTASGKVSITIKNVPGLLLPSTGGIGVIVFYAVGICLLFISIALIIRKRHE